MDNSVLIFAICMLLVPFVVLIPTAFKSAYSFIVVVFTSLYTSYLAISVLPRGYFYEAVASIPIIGNVELKIDELSAVFILLINFTCIMASFYAIGYMKSNEHSRTLNIKYIAFNFLQLSMLTVCMMQDFLPFLIVWESMSFASFLLILIDYEKGNNLKVALNYLVQMHIGVVFLLAATLVIYNNTNETGFLALREYFAEHKNFPVFLLFFIGFGFKLGFLPFHTWVSDTYSAVPPHIASVMSGVMKKLAIYGLIRVLVVTQQDFVLIGIFILIMSMITAIYGIVNGIMQQNISRSLAYSSMENIGIIGIGLGMGVIGKGVGDYQLAILGFTGALLHVFNHSLFKSLLFYGAGAVKLSTGTDNINKLGGMLKKMPLTGYIFLVGSLAICGLPPLNGFMSEFLLYTGIVEGLNTTHLLSEIGLLTGLLTLALVGGLSIYNFTKIFGLAFLGSPRSELVNNAKEVSKFMIAPQILILVVIVSIGFFPNEYIQVASKVVSNLVHQKDKNIAQCLEATQQISNKGLIFGGILMAVFGLRTYLVRRNKYKEAPVWGCGYEAPNTRMQYSATSYANYFKSLAAPFVKTNETYVDIETNDIFPQNRTYNVENEDKIFDKWIVAPLQNVLKLSNKISLLAMGQTQAYLVYGLVLILILFLITFFGII